MANEHIKRCSTSLIIKKMEVETSVRYYYLLIKMSKMKKTGHHYMCTLELNN